MLPIYGGAAIAGEPILDAMGRRGWPLPVRGACWTAGIYAVEAASGEALRLLTGEVPWDYSRPRGRRPVPRHWRGLVRPAYAPTWFLVGWGMENLARSTCRVRIMAAKAS